MICVATCGKLAGSVNATELVSCFLDKCGCPIPQVPDDVQINAYLAAIHNSERIDYLIMQSGILTSLFLNFD